jgi:hypothetical protein
MLRSGEWPARGAPGICAALFLTLSGTGCGPAAAEAPPPIVRTESIPDSPSSDEPGKTVWETCYSSFAPTGDAEGDLSRLVRDCGTTGGMRAITKVKLGTQSSQDPVDRYAFQVPAADKCYRVYAVGDSSVKDLDLLVRGPSGTSMVADITHDSWPVLPPRTPVCVPEPGLYMLEVSVYKGAGKYALQVWGR